MGAFDDLGRAPLHDACWASKPDFTLVDALAPVALFRRYSRGNARSLSRRVRRGSCGRAFSTGDAGGATSCTWNRCKRRSRGVLAT